MVGGQTEGGGPLVDGQTEGGGPVDSGGGVVGNGPDGHESANPPGYFRNGTYKIISIAAYLIGVPKRIFDHDYEPPQKEIYERLERNKNARIIRNLCRLRTDIERNFKIINDKMKYEYKTLYALPELVPTECITQLSNDGVMVIKKTSTKLNHHIIAINRLILERINNCKELFPIWINWDYVRDIFIMPNGLCEEGTAAAAAVYYERKQCYPYQVYMNWPPSDEGNILFNDRKFVTLLYSWNNDEFTDISKVSDAGSMTKDSIYEFLESSFKAVMVVDCENSDPYRLCAVLRSLDPDSLQGIAKIILYDDIHTAPAWRILDTYTSIPVEHHMIQRVKQDKSLVDIQLTAGACREFYQNNVDSFIIASSDSDYWGLISSLPEANFLLMVEREKCGSGMKSALTSSHIFYCYIDDFYTGDERAIQTSALLKAIHRYLDRSFQLNVNDMMEEVYKVTRVTMSDAEKRQFYDKFIRSMHLVIDKNGDASIELKSR